MDISTIDFIEMLNILACITEECDYKDLSLFGEPCKNLTLYYDTTKCIVDDSQKQNCYPLIGATFTRNMERGWFSYDFRSMFNDYINYWFCKEIGVVRLLIV